MKKLPKLSELPELNGRLKEIIDEFSEGNVAKFAKKLNGISQQRLNRIFNIDSRTDKYPGVPDEVLTAIAECVKEVNLDWLLTGKGEMRIQKDDHSVNISGNRNSISRNSGVVGSIVDEVNIHHDEGKDLVLAEKDKEVKKMFEALLEELHGFHAIGERRDKYIARQDEYIASVIKHSYLRNDENMKRMDKLFGQQGELIQKIDDLIRLVDRQNQKVEERADRILDMLEKKL